MTNIVRTQLNNFICGMVEGAHHTYKGYIICQDHLAEDEVECLLESLCIDKYSKIEIRNKIYITIQG